MVVTLRPLMFLLFGCSSPSPISSLCNVEKWTVQFWYYYTWLPNSVLREGEEKLTWQWDFETSLISSCDVTWTPSTVYYKYNWMTLNIWGSYISTDRTSSLMVQTDFKELPATKAKCGITSGHLCPDQKFALEHIARVQPTASCHILYSLWQHERK